MKKMKSETSAIVTMTPPTIIDISPHAYWLRTSSVLAGSGSVCLSPPRSARAVSDARGMGASTPWDGSAGSIAEGTAAFVGLSCAAAGRASNTLHNAESAMPGAIPVLHVKDRMSMPSMQQGVCHARIGAFCSIPGPWPACSRQFDDWPSSAPIRVKGATRQRRPGCASQRATRYPSQNLRRDPH